MDWIKIEKGLPEKTVDCLIVFKINEQNTNFLAVYNKGINYFIVDDNDYYKPEEILAYMVYPKFENDNVKKEEFICYDTGGNITYYDKEADALDELQYCISYYHYNGGKKENVLNCFVGNITHRIEEIVCDVGYDVFEIKENNR